MGIPFSRWYNSIWIRKSRRLFNPEPIEPLLLERLDTIIKSFNPYKEARVVIVNSSADTVFKGIISNYGKVKGAPAFISFIGKMDDPHIYEKIGFTGEGIILEATSLNLGTCWVGLSFRPEIASSFISLDKDERVIAVSPIGYIKDKWSLEEKIITGFGKMHKRKALSELVLGLEESRWPFWVKKSLEAARVAPSAVNRQPWRFFVESESITIMVDNLKDTFGIPKRLDCGIAMLHIYVALLYCGLQVDLELLNSPKVACFKIKSS